MKETMETHDLSAEAWASKADIAPTTITQFVNGKRKFIPSMSTLTRLAEATGQSVRFGVHTFDRISVAKVKVLKFNFRGQVMNVEYKQVSTSIVDDDAFGVQVDTLTMSQAGIFPGDIIVCLPPEQAVVGNTILAVTDKGVSPFRYYPPTLLPASDGEVSINSTDANIIGVAKELIRVLD